MPKRAFTLIELLIVVAILSMLVVIILLLINPTKTIKRSKDTSRAVTAAKVLGAFDAARIANKLNLDTSYSELDLSSDLGQDVLNKAIGSGLETASNKNFNSIYLNYDNATSEYKICFLVESEEFISEWNTQYDKRGNLDTSCDKSNCYTCLGDGVTVSKSLPISKSASSPKVVADAKEPSASWYRATSGSDCNDYCKTLNKSCTDVANSCPSFCWNDSGYAQIEATWATWFNSPKDPINGQTCWGNGPCSTKFMWKPLKWYNARCCCQ